MTALFIDDIRHPPVGDWIVVRSSVEALAWMAEHGVPAMISFDHDLGGDDTAMVVVHALVEQDLDSGGKTIPNDFRYIIHSANPIGAENLQGLLDGYLNHRLRTHAGPASDIRTKSLGRR